MEPKRESFSRLRGQRPARRGGGLVLAVGVVALGALLALAGVDAGYFAVASRSSDHGGGILEATLDSWARKSYDEVAALQGNTRELGILDGSRFRVNVAVSKAHRGQLEIEAVLIDAALGRPVDRLVTYRQP